MTESRRQISTVERRVPPNSLESEMAVIGGIMLKNDSIDLVRPILTFEDFYQPAHQRLYRTMCQMVDKSEPIDPITLKTALKDREWLDEIGGKEYIDRLLDEVHTTANIEHCAQEVLKKSRLRALLTLSFEIQEQTYGNGQVEPENVLESIFGRANEINERRVDKPYLTAEDITSLALERYDDRSSGKMPTGISTGFIDLDEKFEFRQGELTILAATPGMGKTAIACNFATNVSKLDRNVLIFSLEMTATDLVDRMVSAKSRLPLTKILKGWLDATEYENYLNTQQEFASQSGIYIDDSETIGIHDITAKLRMLIKDVGSVDLVIIDYLQLMQLPKSDDRHDLKVGLNVKTMKQIAKKFKTHVLCLSQLSRKYSDRSDKRPKKSDLRDSGEIEQHADNILFPHRPIVFGEEGPDEIIIEKQRNGIAGVTIKVTYTGQCVRFDNYYEGR